MEWQVPAMNQKNGCYYNYRGEANIWRVETGNDFVATKKETKMEWFDFDFDFEGDGGWGFRFI